MNSDKNRKDIFSWLKNVIPDKDDISLQDVHETIIKRTVTSMMRSKKYDTIKYIVGSISKFREKDIFTLDKLGAEIYGRVQNEKLKYEIRIDADGITLKLGDLRPFIIIETLTPWSYVNVKNIDFKEKGIELSEDDIASLQNDLNAIFCGISRPNNRVIEEIREHANDESWYDLIYAPFFAQAFECICFSVLSGEYAMDDKFSQTVRDLSKRLRKATLHEGDNSWLTSLAPWVVTLSQILDEYNLFCIQIDTQVDKDPSAVLRKSEEYYNRHEYVENFYRFMSSQAGLSQFINPMLLHFFQAFLEMARIDQNFYFSTNNFSSLMYLQELLDDGDKSEKGFVRVWEKWGKESLVYDFKGIQDVLELARLKNGILLRKMWEGCYEELKDLTYVGQDKVLIFDPRKCREKEVGEEYHTELLLRDKLFDKDKKDRVQEFLKMTKALVDGSCFKETDKSFEGYEKEYIKSKWGDENLAMKATDDYYRNIMMSQTSHTSLDIRHYNSKVIEMSRDSVYYTADFRIWIKHHKYDYDEAVAFPQIHKVLLFLQSRYSDGKVCYDSEMLEGYAKWCIEFLNMVSKKSPEPDSSRPSQIEEALLLLETVNSLLDRLVVSIEKGNYCLPFASKFRGCFFKYNKQVKTIEEQVSTATPSASVGNGDNTDKGVSPILERVFVEGNKDDGYKKEDFEPFISAGTSEERWNGWSDDEQMEKRKDILFIASSFVPPFNLERLKDLKTKFKIDTHKLRNEIHADYFNRLREYVKEDSMKQLEENRRSVVQILGIFAAFLALTTVALGGAKDEIVSTGHFVHIMVGFTVCIVLFVLLLFIITRINIWKSIEQQNKRDKITENWIYEEVISMIGRNTSDNDSYKNSLFHIQREIDKKIKKIDEKNVSLKRNSEERIELDDLKKKIRNLENKIFRQIWMKVLKTKWNRSVRKFLYGMRKWGWVIAFIVLVLFFISIYGRTIIEKIEAGNNPIEYVHGEKASKNDSESNVSQPLTCNLARQGNSYENR